MRVRADRRVGVMLGGIVAATFIGLGATVALPATDPDVRMGEGAELTDEHRRGQEVFRNEGCWTCHSGYIRSGDGVHGDGSGDDELAGLSPVMIGTERLGPDLTRVGNRVSEADLRELLAAGGSGLSSMPSYAHLSEADTDALVAYLLAQR